ncbi:MAG: hypothetical protein GWN58_37360, partial [Anaerolineae bacterium]|nr:hypothetical protein [Anaerolineae bacterium]
MFGWEEQEGLGGRLLRGVADFGLQVAIDPLTYVTFGFGAIAKKAAIEAGESLVRQSTKNIVASAAGTLKDDALKPFEKIARAAVYDEGGAQALRRQFKLAQAQNGGQLPEHLAEVTRRQFGTDDITQLSDEMFAELALFQHYHDNLMRPLARKDFAAIPKELRDELPGFLRGGARIAPPIGPKG